ncbi:hypothetical protein EKO04_004573 [Ascochyta lentis]|uniref:Uncharacterized protein n=1 Tax=Ascochyta lentis TaxID=205686 RepID=A0A8H7J578_9PLEO|nr:hypothetical protein EKO04_004573 [Ascochyta lentis]
MDKAVADEIRRILAFAPIDIRRVADYFLRPRNQSPYNAVFGTSVRDYSPVVALVPTTALLPFKSDGGARCRFANPRTGSSSKSTNGTSSAFSRSGGRAVAAPVEEGHFSNAE